MTEYSRFFDGTSYTEAQFNEVINRIVKNDGILYEGSGLQVIQHTAPAMSVDVGTGEAFIKGAWYQNTAAKTMTIETADPTNPRIDRIVLRLSWSANSIVLAVLKGTAAASPSAPTLTQTSGTWELSLAQVRVAAGATSIVTANITDERLTAYCGWAACNIGAMYIQDNGELNANGYRIKGLADPYDIQDAATKAYAAPLVSPALTGTPTAPTATGSSATQIVNWTALQNAFSTWASWSPSLSWAGYTPPSIVTTARRLIVGKIVYFVIDITHGAPAGAITGLTITGLPGTVATSNATVPIKAIQSFPNTTPSTKLDINGVIYTTGGGSIQFISFASCSVTCSFFISGFYEVT